MTLEESAGDDAACGSLAELRAEHLAMLRSWRRSEGADAGAIIAFSRRIAATGGMLSEEVDRETAQDFLDYWDAQLLSIAGSEGIRRFEPQLASFAPDLGEGKRPIHPSPADAMPESPTDKHEITKNIEASEQLRLGALARQWRQSNGVQSYLLSGAALARASAFRHKDPEIEAFVASSERREARRKRRKNRYIAAGVTSALIIIGGLATLLYAKIVAQTAQMSAENQLGQARSVSDTYLSRLQRVTNTLIEAGPDRSVDGLLRLTYLIDNADDARGPWIVENLKRGLAPFAAPPAAQARATDSLVGNLMHFSVDGLTLRGRDNLLQVLASISLGQWSGSAVDAADKPGWLNTRAGARRAAAFLDAKTVDLSTDAQTELERLRKSILLDPSPSQTVVLRLADAVKGHSDDVITGIVRLQWTPGSPLDDKSPPLKNRPDMPYNQDRSQVVAQMNDDIQRVIQKYRETAPAATPSQPTANEIAYGAPADQDAAEMLSADLSKCGYTMGAVRADPSIEVGTLEARLAIPPADKQGCIPPGLAP